MNNKPKLIVILGPTASGKSKLAVQLARKFDGEIISADSRQVYHGMDIGTAKITKKEMGGVPHYLLDVANPERRFTVAQYKKLALAAIKKILKKGKIPIICGGSGFYIQAIVDNISIPEVKPDLKLRANLEKKTAEQLFAELKKLDPNRAKNIDRFNKRRLIRALEIIYKTGRPVPPFIISHPCHPELDSGSRLGFRVKPGMTSSGFDTLFIGVKKTKNELTKMIHQRLLRRLKQGLITEVKKLKKTGLSWRRLEEFGLEYRWIAKYLQKKIDYQTMINSLQKDSEHFAKRQMTWFKRDNRIHWIKNKNQGQKLAAQFLNKGY